MSPREQAEAATGREAPPALERWLAAKAEGMTLRMISDCHGGNVRTVSKWLRLAGETVRRSQDLGDRR
jgi:hypothetical protein